MLCENPDDPAEFFHGIVVQNHEALRRTARARLRNDDLAREAVQETFYQAFRCFERFEPGTNARAWLFSILRNVIRQEWRRYVCRWQTSNDHLFVETLRAPETALPMISDKRVLASLTAIPPTFAQIVVLSDVEDLSYREIADALQLPIGTVMSRLSRGRRLLRERLWEVAEELGITTARATVYPDQKDL
jgi:RNA polymerase sigma-70 factor (ECF subfamily)